jgi:hypothetical protein
VLPAPDRIARFRASSGELMVNLWWRFFREKALRPFWNRRFPLPHQAEEMGKFRGVILALSQEVAGVAGMNTFFSTAKFG